MNCELSDRSWAARAALLVAVCGVVAATHAHAQGRDPVVARVLAEMQAGNREAAEVIVDSLLMREPNRYAALVLRGHLRLQAGDRDAAKAAFERGVQVAPDRPEAHYGRGLAEFESVLETQRAVLTLKKIFRSDPEKRAEEYFKKALELEPEYHDAAIALAELYLNRGSDDDFDKVIEVLQPRLGTYRLNDMFYALARALIGLERYGEAENILVQLLTRDPEHNGGLLRSTELYTVLGRTEQASDAYRRLTYVLYDPDVLEDVGLPMRPILDHKQRDELYNSDDPGGFLRRFWNGRDPTPTTLANERLVEHFDRVLFARLYYRSNQPRGYDDRGEVHIRFGKPTDRYISVGGNTTKSNESWAYTQITDRLLTFDFVDMGGGVYKTTTNLADAMSSFPLDPEDRITALTEVFQERQHLSPEYARAAGDLLTLRDQSSGSIGQEVAQTTEAVREYQLYAEEVQGRAPGAAYDRPDGVDELDGTMTMARFRGGSRLGRVEVEYGVPAPELSFVRGADDMSRAVVEESFALFDNSYEEVARARRQRSLEVTDPEGEDQAYVGLLAIPPELSDGPFLAAADYRLAFAVRDVSSNKSKVFWVSFSMPSFAPDSLSMSDLQISRAFDDERPPPALEPYPYTAIDVSERLYVHYEVYGLEKAEDGLTDFHVIYTVEAPDGVVASVLGRLNPFDADGNQGIAIDADRRGVELDERDVVELDLGELTPGRYRLTIAVEDRVAKHKVESSIELDIVGNL